MSGIDDAPKMGRWEREDIQADRTFQGIILVGAGAMVFFCMSLLATLNGLALVLVTASAMAMLVGLGLLLSAPFVGMRWPKSDPAPPADRGCHCALCTSRRAW
jgi:hypothetical protein